MMMITNVSQEATITVHNGSSSMTSYSPTVSSSASSRPSHVSSATGGWVKLTFTPHTMTATGLGASAATAECLSYSYITQGALVS